MMWEPRPVPKVSPETEPFWKAASNNKLLINKCSRCGLILFYPRALCPDCFSENKPVEASGLGAIYTYSVVYQISGWPSEYTPVIVAYVELEEGPRVFTNIMDTNPESIQIGDPVKVDFIPTKNTDISIPVFKPK